MLSQNPRADNFNIILPMNFFIDEIIEKYNKLLSQKPYPFDNIIDMLAESIQSFDTPEYGIQPVEQNLANANGTSDSYFTLPKQSLQRAADSKTFQISYRHSDGYLTYFMMMEHFFHRLKLGNDDALKPFGTTFLEFKIPTGEIVYRLKFEHCHLIGVPSLALTYATPSRDFTTFICNFAYTQFQTTFEIPEPKLKS